MPIFNVVQVFLFSGLVQYLDFCFLRGNVYPSSHAFRLWTPECEYVTEPVIFSWGQGHSW